MQVSPILIFGLILAYAFIQTSDKSKQMAPAEPLRLWQSLAGAIAIVMALLIIMNPEFLALGLLGDTAFFDLLVLALSLQLQDLAAQAWHRASTTVSGFVRWFFFPRPSCQAFLLIFAPIGTMISSARKLLSRLFPNSNCLA
jgi:hypothetical protein